MSFWEVRRIVRGYRRRNILSYQLQRLTAYSAFFSMRDNKSRIRPQEWLPLYFDHINEMSDPTLTDEEIEEMQRDMEAYNLELLKSKP